ncbi:MAG: ATP-binding protein [Thermoguttaceae bacterium]|jgi:hypothetical protein|nr:ATP-binding protein [Thermoguttaceae bacterium]
MDFPLTRRRRGTRVRRAPCPRTPAAFTSDDELLNASIQLFAARQALVEAEQTPGCPREALRAARDEERAWTRYWHASLRLGKPNLALGRLCRRHRLNRTECEILAALVLGQLSLLEQSIGSCADVLDTLAVPGAKAVEALRMLSEHGRLYRAGLLAYDDPDEDLARRSPMIDPTLVDAVLSRNVRAEKGWRVGSEQELYERLQAVTQALARKSEQQGYLMQSGAADRDTFKTQCKVRRLMSRLEETLQCHRNWKLAAYCENRLNHVEWLMFLALLGKALGHLPPDHELFTGGGLARAAAPTTDHYHRVLGLLGPASGLVSGGLVRPCGGAMELATDDPQALQDVEFELTRATADELGLRKLRLVRPKGEYQARRPQVRMSQLVLPPEVARALDLAAVHARSARRLSDDWGLGELIPYGGGMSLLFSGMPGTGKTAAAEALAHRLGRPILAVDYSRIQNCFVGQTEKNIVRAFREAADQEAVLFWDEADAMFFDRDSARHNWEIRDVNVLLQQLERFDGVCILATNRKVALDGALQRRIALKIDFPRPDRDHRRQIWQRLLPRKLPLARDVELDVLSRADLVGGEIKNIILNAARLALQRTDAGLVTMHDFQTAIRIEQEGGWNGAHGKRIGFGV